MFPLPYVLPHFDGNRAPERCRFAGPRRSDAAVVHADGPRGGERSVLDRREWDGILVAPGGQMGYAFPRRRPDSRASGWAMRPFSRWPGPPVWDPMTYGNPNNAYSYSQGGLMNANGIAVAVDYYGVTDHYATGEAYYVQRNADGSWGTPVAMWYGQGQFPFGPSVPGVSVEGINKLNQVLGTMTGNMLTGSTDAALYNINTGTLTDLSNLGPLSGHYSNV